jgi:hypothetical protein
MHKFGFVWLWMALACLCTPAFAQSTPPAQPQLPPGFDRVAFFGDILARMSFCGFHYFIDEYEMGMAMKAFGVIGSDRPAIEAVRDKNYALLREKYKTAKEHGDFCIQNRSHPFFMKASRKGIPLWVGSDTDKQPEKVELFGDLFAAITFCKMPIDGNKWGRFLSDMGVKSESMPAMSERAAQTQRAYAQMAGTPQVNALCNETRSNPNVARFSK